ncbi:MAG: helix-hairpin-helix domain-containing protein [Rickettsiales bacterium]
MSKEPIKDLAQMLKGQNIKGLTSYEPKMNELGNAALFGVIGIKLLKTWHNSLYPYEGKKGNLRGSSSDNSKEHQKNVDTGFTRRINQNAPRFMEEIASLDPEELAKLSGISTKTVDEIMKGVVELCKIHSKNIGRPVKNCDTRFNKAVAIREDKKYGQGL